MSVKVIIMIKILIFFTLLLFMSIFNAYGQEFKITTYNTFLLPQAVNRHQLERAPCIASYLLENNSDVFVLQECFNTKAIDIINNKIKNLYPYQFKDTSKNMFRLCSGLWILSKYPILEHDFVKFIHCCSWDCLADKGCAFVKIKFNDNIIRIFGTHLNSTSDQDTRNEQYKEMKVFINKHTNNNDLEFILGDLNTIKSNSMGFNNLLKTLGVQNYTTEYLSYDARHNNLHDEWICGVIDYIFVNNSPISNIIKRYIDIPKADWDCKNIHHDLSDHYPVILKIILDK